jgi:hypothetical protein
MGVGDTWHRYEGKGSKERCKWMNRVQRMHVHVVNAKMTPVETVPGIR